MGFPFGYSSSTNEPKNYQTYIASHNPKIFWALRDGDQILISGNTDLSPVQSHKKGHNHLFFDGSVKMLNEANRKAVYQKINNGGY